ncbi:hypothetical protein THAOC_28645 [Thalassiosira oceanica]|uniref:Uncharacterized protein n=1 Tax=Thalassiosira oceanica TaxID=159749 RepID=K0RTA0_THAOC|nr:hypothetical protein THAOC_28645 [Thalassiosira oceanica]|eukprot:EJK52121.1 hypothetical protein THAOC_28645 [Thalassiosira oceanica]
MTFRRDWRRQGGCRRHSGGCRVSAEVAWRRKRALRSLLGAMDGGSDGDDEPGRSRGGAGPGHGRVAGKKTLPEDADGRRGLGRHRRREACPPIPLRVDERRRRRRRLVARNSRRGWWGGSDGGEETSRAGDDETPGADFSSIRDDDGTASVYSGMGKRALGFLHAQSSRAEE